MAYVGERLRRLALGLLAALITARAYATSEPDLENGAGTGLYWILALLVVTGVAFASGFIGGRLRFRWSWADVAVVSMAVLVATSSLHAIDRRPALNLAWEWMAFGIAYLLLRNLPRTREESSVLAGVLVVVAIAVSIYGLYQVGVELRPIRDAYRRNPQAVLQILKIAPGTPQQALFENRLMQSSEPWSTFALANSLAGFIVGPLVMLLTVGLYNLENRDPTRPRWSALVMAAPLVLIVLVCLLLTKSRSAWIGLIGGMVVVAWQWRRLGSRRLMLGAGLAGLVVVGALVAAGLATRQLDPEVLTQSSMSMRYRWEYWQGAWKVITGGKGNLWQAAWNGPFWSGTGPGNFRSYYLRYKLPEASEEVFDPHDLFLEVWATGGFGAFLALLAALGLGLWNLLGPPSRSTASTENGHSTRRRKDDRRATDTMATPAPPKWDEDPDVPPSRPAWLIASAFSGWVLVVLLGMLNPFEKDLYLRWLILGMSWVAAALLLRPLWQRLPIPAVALGVAVVAVLINLLAAGGIGIPTVALELWATMALGLNLRDDRDASRLREYESRVPSFVLLSVWAAMLGLFLGAVVPFWRSEAVIAEAEDAIRRRDFDGAEAIYERALDLDYYNVRPWLGYANLQQLAWESRGSKPEDLRWPKIPILLEEALKLPRNPSSWSLHILRADRIRALLQRVGGELSPKDAVKYSSEIVKETRIATLLYPSNASLHARLADASAEISMFGDAWKEAEEALRLDQLMTPHPDKRLPASVRRHLENQLAEWKEKGNAISKP
ncbi:MAG: O-antigen ligase family protein [Isosphaeraceae bacterium]